MAQPQIGIVTTSFGSAFTQRALPVLEKAAREAGFDLHLFETMSFNKAEVDFLIEDLVALDGLKGLLYLQQLFTQSQLREFIEKDIRVVNLAGRMEGIDWVMTDEIKGSYDATKLILAQGHRRIALINGPAVSLTSRLREDGYLRAMKEAGVELGQGIQILNFVESEGYEAANLLLDEEPRPTALFVASGDITALGVYQAIQERGLSIPGDISVMGYDNLPFTEKTSPPMTTVNQPLETMSAKAMEILKGRLDGSLSGSTQGLFFDPDIVTRASLDTPHDD